MLYQKAHFPPIFQQMAIIAIWTFLLFWILKYYWSIQLIYNVVLVSGVQQNESIIHKCTLFLIYFSHIGFYRVWVEFPVLYSMSFSSVQFSSVAQSCPALCNPMNCSTPGLPVHHHLPEFTKTHVHRVSDAIQPSHPLSSPSAPDPNPSQHQSLFQWVNSLHEVAKVLEFQL